MDVKTLVLVQYTNIIFNYFKILQKQLHVHTFYKIKQETDGIIKTLYTHKQPMAL